MKPDRNKALDMWCAKKPDGTWLHRDRDLIAWACGYSNGACLSVVVTFARKKGDARAVFRPREAPVRSRVAKLADLENFQIAERLGLARPNNAAVHRSRAKKRGEIPSRAA